MSGSVNPLTLNPQSVTNTFLPGKEGPKIVPVTIDLLNYNTFDLDLTKLFQQGLVSQLQSVFIDNSSGYQPVTMLCRYTGQSVVVPAYSQGTFPIFSAADGQFVFTSIVQNYVKVYFSNVPLPCNVWLCKGNQFVSNYETFLLTKYGNNNVGYAETIATAQACGTVNTSGSVIKTAPAGSYLFVGGISLSISADAAAASAGDWQMSVQDNGTSIFVASLWLPASAPTLTQAGSLTFNSGPLSYYTKAAGTNLTLGFSSSLTSGRVSYNVAYSATNQQGQ